ncbi:3-oxoacyl-[acyl-carrier protein] reductase [Exophiala aquamarina CBS 119918]|uniref:3-oxoacyl-[acyl-carrier protein] reductase n=1 Tax=Exophiala aquamarina CBS 119918 TaxID=1182545 RepID=A0A072PS32_9EURO|nr:3-oxoacyl-[acyl-carrier protein] reductase [Exophiala aquamarina CBS 119918]KEF62904.1 3-oxoacyl-[acyl-carrier protein] reductase [Exophiala aquamarina CBS 119918]
MAEQTRPNRLSLSGKVAVVSGSSMGIGAAIAKELHKRGADVVINYPFVADQDGANNIVKSLPQHARAIAVEADLSTLDGPQILVDKAVQAFGKIDILVNNAGVVLPSPVDEPDLTKVAHCWEKTMNLNGRGTMLLTRAVLPHLSRENSRIVNIGACMARNPLTFMSFYAGSKGMIESFTRAWARELPPKYACTVNAVAPGPVATEGLLSTSQPAQDALKPVLDTTPVGARLGKPEEIAWVVAMLCEDDASWVNGAIVPVSGGSTLL